MGLKNFIRKIFHSPHKVSFEENYNKTNLPIVTFMQGKKKINFILDTGASSSILNKKALQKIKHKLIEDNSGVVTGIDGSTSFAADQYEIPISYNNEDFFVNVLAIDIDGTCSLIEKETGVKIHGLLGCNFFEENKYIIDFQKKIAYRNDK